jgi:DNA-binding NtrC family response regulator
VLPPGTSLRAAVASFERDAIVAALEAAGGNKSRAASELGISRFALQRKLGKYGLAEAAGDGDDEVEETLSEPEEDEQELSEA